MILSIIALPFTASADGYYAKLGYGLQDGLNGGNNASEYGLTVGKKLNDLFSAEIKTRLKVKDGSTGNDQRAEFALIGSKKIMGPVSLYARGGAGYKLTRDKSHEYWHIEPGLKYKLNELQCFAEEVNVDITNNIKNKKKTKNELANDLFNYYQNPKNSLKF